MENPTGVIPGDNMLYHKPHVCTECMFGFDAETGCTDCIANKFWTGAYTSSSNPSDNVGWNSVYFQLALFHWR